MSFAARGNNRRFEILYRVLFFVMMVNVLRCVLFGMLLFNCDDDYYMVVLMLFVLLVLKFVGCLTASFDDDGDAYVVASVNMLEMCVMVDGCVGFSYEIVLLFVVECD